MKELICTNPKTYKLTLGVKYTIITDEGDSVMIINDNNKAARYYKELFEEVDDEIIPEPEPVVVRTEQDLIDSITSVGLMTTCVDFQNENIIIPNTLNIVGNSNSFSCGVKNITDITEQLDIIYDNISNTEDIIGEDLPMLTKAIVKHHFKNFIKHQVSHGFNAGVYLMSCNISGDVGTGLNEETVNILNEISDFNTEPQLNPNSGNYIMIWGFYKSNLDN